MPQWVLKTTGFAAEAVTRSDGSHISNPGPMAGCSSPLGRRGCQQQFAVAAALSLMSLPVMILV